MTEDRELRPATRKQVSVRSEPQPSGEVLARIEAVEDHGVRRFWGVESEEQFRVRFQSWRDTPNRRAEDMPEPEDMVELEDRNACELRGLDFPTYGEFLLATLPGFVHGYSRGGTPDTPTNARPGSEEKIKVYRQRIRQKQTLHHPRDSRHAPPPMTNEEDDE